jgi:uncharacterized protein (AIM24 family)
VSIGIFFQKRVMTGLFGGEGFIMQSWKATAGCSCRWAARWSSATLAPGEELHIDTGCLAAYTPSVDFDLVMAGGVKSVLFGGEGLFFARLRGPGRSGSSRCRSRAWPAG